MTLIIFRWEAIVYNHFSIFLGMAILSEIRQNGGVLLKINCDTENGEHDDGIDLIVDFGKGKTVLPDVMKHIFMEGIVPSDIWL